MGLAVYLDLGGKLDLPKIYIEPFCCVIILNLYIVDIYAINKSHNVDPVNELLHDTFTLKPSHECSRFHELFVCQFNAATGRWFGACQASKFMKIHAKYL